MTVTPTEGESVTGRIVRAGGEAVTIEVPATKKTPARRVDLAYADLARAVVQVEFSRAEDRAPDASDDAELPDAGEDVGTTDAGISAGTAEEQ